MRVLRIEACHTSGLSVNDQVPYGRQAGNCVRRAGLSNTDAQSKK